MIPEVISGLFTLGAKLYERWKNGSEEEKAAALAEAVAAQEAAEGAAAKAAVENEKLRADSDAAIKAAEERAAAAVQPTPLPPAEFDTSDADHDTDPGKKPTP